MQNPSTPIPATGKSKPKNRTWLLVGGAGLLAVCAICGVIVWFVVVPTIGGVLGLTQGDLPAYAGATRIPDSEAEEFLKQPLRGTQQSISYESTASMYWTKDSLKTAQVAIEDNWVKAKWLMDNTTSGDVFGALFSGTINLWHNKATSDKKAVMMLLPLDTNTSFGSNTTLRRELITKYGITSIPKEATTLVVFLSWDESKPAPVSTPRK